MSNLAFHKNILEDVKRPKDSVDGNTSDYTNNSGFTFFTWPGLLTLDLGEISSIMCIRILLWDGLGKGNNTRHPMSYNYRLSISQDQKNWFVIHDTLGYPVNGWQVFKFNESINTQYIRIYGIGNSNLSNRHFSIVQIEAYDSPPPELDAEIITNRNINISECETENGDGTHLSDKIKTTIDELVDLVSTSDWKNPKLEELISRLKIKINDINSIEKDMESIRREITNPVASEIKKGSKISRLSLIVGIVGGIFAIVSIVLTVLTLVC